MEEWAKDIALKNGLVTDFCTWPYTHIDWYQAANYLKTNGCGEYNTFEWGNYRYYFKKPIVP